MNTDKRILAVGKVHGDWLEVHLAPQQERVSEDKTLTLAEMEAENAEYRDDIEDRQFHARGQW